MIPQNVNIRERVIKEIAVKIMIARIPAFGLAEKDVDEAVKIATKLFDFPIPIKP